MGFVADPWGLKVTERADLQISARLAQVVLLSSPASCLRSPSRISHPALSGLRETCGGRPGANAAEEWERWREAAFGKDDT